MASYDALLSSQSANLDAIKRINENFKKDSSSRKSTLEYHDDRLTKLEGYWNEFKKNDAQLSLFEGEKSGPYYENSIYDRLEQIYEETKSMLLKSKQRLLAKFEDEKFTSFSQLQKQEERSVAQESVSRKQESDEIVPEVSNTSNEELAVDQRTRDMIHEQRSNIKAFERTVRNINIDNLKEKWQLEDKLRTITQRWEKVDTTYWRLDNTLTNMQPFENEYNRLERLYEFSKEQINKRIWDSKHQEKSTPKIELPIFSGSYAQWTTFKDLFVEIVHRNTFISNAQKMQHLKAKLKGEPERLIQHMNISADNYEASWQILQQRYDNKCLLFSYQANILLNLPNIQTPTASLLKRMHDTTIECLQAIKNLKYDISSWDPLVVYILMQKLDADTRQSLKESLENPREMPTLKEFLKFIEIKFMSMESGTSPSTGPSRPRTFNIQQANIQQKSVHNATYSKPKIQEHAIQGGAKHIPKTFQNKQISQNSFITCPKCNKHHGLYNCREFLCMSPDERLKTASNLQVCLNCLFSHNGEKCTSEKKCKHCDEAHSSILHDAISVAKSRPGRANVGQQVNTHLAHDNSNEVLLATAQVKTIAHDGTTIILRALLDQGSQVSLITENAAQRLQLKRNKLSAVVSGVGASATTKCKGVLRLKCQAIYSEFNININALIMKTITNKLPSKTINKDSFEHIQHLQLADPDFNISQEIDLLLGADIYSEILLEGLIKTSSSSIIAQQTHLGWVVCGNYKTFNCHVIVNNIQDLAQFWEQESLQDNKEDVNPDNKCEQLYEQTTTRLPHGRYQVRLPLKDNFNEHLGTSKPQAIAQFQQLERKMAKNAVFARDYKAFIQEYEEMGHMAQAEGSSTAKKLEYFLPHHGVVRPGAITTKLRVVFNASAKTSSKHSLNDLMEAGPNLQKDILSILLKWRQYRYVLTSDIEKMYRFIMVHPDHQSLQKIVWRDCPRQLLREYQLRTVTYGTKAAPFLALRTLQQLAMDEGDKYPEAKNILLNQFFVDDALFGKDTIEEARDTRDQLIQLLKEGGFNLRKWSSNEHQLLHDLPEHMVSPVSLKFTDASDSKALGLAWDPKQDKFIFSSTLKNKTTNIKYNKATNNNKNSTKRQILSDISTIFDPLGLLSPITIKAKILFQQIWKYKTEWDDGVPDIIEKEWRTLKTELINMQPFKINRWLGLETSKNWELHAFCDASEKAFSCVVYSKVTEGNKRHISLVAAKTKVAPIQKQQTLPRLELCGAQLLAQLVQKIKRCLDRPNIKVTAWTDSMIVLGWLKGNVSRWKAYVGHRVQEITSVVPADSWNHVRSEHNPADCASRGLLPSQLHNYALWFHGPEWLNNDYMPKTYDTFKTPEIEVKNVHAITSRNIENINIITELLIKYNCIINIIRIIAWVSRFITNASQNNRHHREHPTMNHTYIKDPHASKQCNLTLDEIRRATDLIIKQVQYEHYGQEINDLKTKGSVCNNKGLQKLYPYLDKNNILRVGGRLQNSNLPEETKHPAIIPKNSKLAKLLIARAHITTLHGGARLTLATLRQKYWITGGNNTVKKYLQDCVKCCRYKPSKQYQLMADLPSERTTQSPPFYHTGVDFTGFVSVKLNKGRGVRTSKGYIVVFVCMATKAVHLELASDLSSQTFIMALNRLIGRRGCPKHIYSDNGTNFVGAEKELAKQLQISKTFNNETLTRRNTELGIEWHFNAPSWPTAGGLWEAAVKSMKYHLKRVLGEQKLTYEEFLTLLTQIEACMNSRPLCPLTEDVDDIDYLTPAHFLIGRPVTFLPTENYANQDVNIRNRWQFINKMKQGFWNRWSSEYLQQLQVRSKWLNKTSNLSIGDVVLIKEDNLPPAKWALGRIQEVHPGRDNLVRVVTMKTKTGLLTRPITKLVKLPTEEPKQEILGTTTTDDKICKKTQKATTKNTNSKQRVKSRNINSSLLCVLLTLLTLFQPTKQSSDTINITPFESNRAVYFDKIGNLQTVHDDWKIVTYYNMTTYWQGMENILRVVNHLKERCDQFAYRTMCKTIMTEFGQELDELNHNNYMLETHHGQIRGRITRGLVDGVGYLANSLFGVLDARFAEQYKKDIETLHNNRDHLLNLIKGQTSIIEAHNNILKRNEEAMNTQFNLLDQHLNATDSYLQKLGKAVQEDEALNYFNIMALTCSTILSKLRHIQHMLLDTAINIHHGHVDTRLLPQNQLFQELNIISGQLPQHLSLPVDNVQNQLADIYKLLEVKSRLFDQYFIIEITLPLTGDTPFTIYKTIPIPMIKNSNQSLTMKTNSEYIAVNVRKETYMQLTESDLEHCIKIEPSTYICSLNQPTRNMRNYQIPCEIGAITNITLAKCIYTSESCNNKWTPLQKPNTWLYVCCTDCQLQIICEGRMTTKAIHLTGILEAREGCIIRNNEETYYTQVYYTNKRYVNPEIPLMDLEDINNLTSVQPLDLSTGQQHTKFVRNDYDKLHNTLKELEEQTRQTEMSQHDMHQYIVSYSTMGLLILSLVVAGGAYAYCKRCGKVTVSVAGASTRLPPRKPPRAAASIENIELHHATAHSFNI